MAQRLLEASLTRFLLSVTALSMVADTVAAQVDELVVTARKREENLQTVPLAITAFTGEALERAGVDSLREITNQVAGLQFDGFNGGFLTSPVIRGLSQISRLDDENNVSIFIDGVYVSGRDGLDFSLLDIERVEVVKGPQSALYGRNSYAGAINFITKKPGDQIDGQITGTVGNDEMHKVAGTVSGPIIPDILSGRIGAAYNAFGGSYEDVITGGDIGGFESVFLSGTLVFTPTDNLDLTASVYYADDEIDPAAQLIIPGNCEPVPASPFTTRAGEFQAFCGEVPAVTDGFASDPRAFGLNREVLRTSLRWDLDLGAVTVTSLTGYNLLQTDSVLDQDRQLQGVDFITFAGFPPAPTGTATLPSFVSGGNLDDQDEFSQEIRIASNGDAPFKWLIGGSYYALDIETSAPFFVDISNVAPPNFIFFPSMGSFQESTRETNTWAVYGSASYDFTDRLTGRAELRYTREEKEARTFPSAFQATDNSFREIFEFFTPRVTLDFEATNDVLVYGSVARGAKAGGFNTSGGVPSEFQTFDPEFNWTYEVGAKTEWLDGSMRVNIAAFYVDMNNIQVTTRLPGTVVFAVQNSGTGTSKGVEIEADWRPANGLDVGFNYALADSEFDDAFDSSLRTLPSFAATGGADVSGQQLPRTSKHTLNGSIQYQQPLMGDVDWYVRFDGRYETAQKGFSSDLLERVGDRFIGNLRAGLTSEHWEVVVWSDNIFDEDTPTLASTTASLSDFTRFPVINAPQLRTFGVTATLRY